MMPTFYQVLSIHHFFCFQFRALSDQFYRTPEHHKFVRQEVVNQVIVNGNYILLTVSLVCGKELNLNSIEMKLLGILISLFGW